MTLGVPLVMKISFIPQREFKEQERASVYERAYGGRVGVMLEGRLNQDGWANVLPLKLDPIVIVADK